MQIHSLKINNFRRLKNVIIDFDKDISIFVGANNSGKTSTIQALQLFINASRERFSIHDFSAECWLEINNFGAQIEGSRLPAISIDIWFHVESTDIHRVIDLLPGLNWEGSLVGLRIEFAASNESTLLANFNESRARAQANIPPGREGDDNFRTSPSTLCDFLKDNLRREFEFHYYILDYARFDHITWVAEDGYTPLQITPNNGRGGKEILNSIVRVDFLSAQRHLSDSAGGSRAEDLSRRFSRFYDQNLEKCITDYDTMQALTESETMLNEHLKRVFEPTLRSLAVLGYPGIANPSLVIKSSLNPATIMSSHDGATVHYALGNHQNGVEQLTLPERYNGLGFKNLIYMVVELLDLHAQWMGIVENRPPLHLIFIEEPETHLHAQLQQVFIRKVLDILSIDRENAAYYHNQIVVTTHSSHILYELGFQPIRYFRRNSADEYQTSEVLNLSTYYARTENPTRDFLERYLKLTHCDLFFADAAVLVEGNVERLLLPVMIEKVSPRLKSAYLCILEIGGAFGYRFRSLIEYLGITTLIVTDIDSVSLTQTEIEESEHDVMSGEESAGTNENRYKACMVNTEGAITSNQTLIQWLPRKSTISELQSATIEECTQQRNENTGALIHITYQCQTDTIWHGETRSIIGRTLEEAFAFENLEWCQAPQQADLNLIIRGNARLNFEQLTDRIHKKIKSSSFNKTDFALALLIQDPASWNVPKYIVQGLHWLQNEIIPVELSDSVAGEVEE